MRVIHFLHAHGHCYTTGSYWTKKFKTWINQIELERSHDEFVLRGHLNDIDYHQGRIYEQQVKIASESEKFQQAVQILQGFRGIGLISAMQLVCEIGDFRRFESPTALMAYLGLVPSPQETPSARVQSPKLVTLTHERSWSAQHGNTSTRSVLHFKSGKNTAVLKSSPLPRKHKHAYTNVTTH